MVETIKNVVMIASMLILAISIFTTFIRALIGPRLADRILAINMIGTQVILLICILAVYLKESGIVDMAIIYAMFSFLSVVVFARIYLGVYNEKIMKARSEDEEV